MSTAQTGYDLRCEWGEHGVVALAPECDAIVIVDVLSFTTAVSVAIDRGALAIPHRWQDESAGERAQALGALLAGPRGSGFSLSPLSLLDLPEGSKIVLPSPNGSTLSLGTGATPTYAGCLRNARAVARAAARHGRRVAVVPAGERWPDESLRPSLEDLVGAGAVLRELGGTRSPEAETTVAAFEAAFGDLEAFLLASVEGRWLTARGYEQDVVAAADLDASAYAPRLLDGAYTRESPPPEDGESGLVVRAYREADETDVALLWSEAFPGSPSHNEPHTAIRRKLRVQRDLFLVGLEDGRVVATAMAGFDGHRGWVYYMATARRARGRGFASRLLAEAESRLRARGCTKLNLQVRGGNEEVAGFYERQGFTREDRLSFGKHL
jgi:2-phosphosulfolactate phosphatase